MLRDIKRMMVGDLTDTDGAVKILSRRFNREYNRDTIHLYVRQGKIQAYIFQGGELVPRDESNITRGKDLIFVRADIAGLEKPRSPGKPTKEAVL